MPKDLFSQHASEYAKYRPTYPRELIEYIVSFVKEKEIAWDCATGNGQAAILLAKHFKKVIATDISEDQLSQAEAQSKIEYKIAAAESTPFDDHTFDLITVAQAYHWLDLKAFSQEVHRVGKKNFIVAIFCYGLVSAKNKKIDELIVDFYKNVTGPYWEFERKYVDDGYASAPFYFKEIRVKKSFSILKEWNIEQLSGYINTWSAVKKFIAVNHYNPVDKLIEEISKQWNDESVRRFEFEIGIRVGARKM